MNAKEEKISPNFRFFQRELIIIILSKLRCKDIVRFKTVCKEWLDIILNFAKTHHENNLMTLVCREGIIDCYKKKSENKRGWFYKLDPYKSDAHLVGPGGSWIWFDVVNSCKGFLLMEGTRRRTYGVYNPLTNEKVFLPNPMELSDDWDYVTLSCGLGFSPVTRRFKVVVVVRDCSRDTYNLLIYTLGNASSDSSTGAWWTVSIPESHRHRLPYEHPKNNPTEFNGVLHWQALTADAILSFDVEKEEFGEMSSPYNGEPGKDLRSIGVYRGLLCLGITVFGYPRQLEMWVMKEYGIKESWMRLVVVKSMSIYSPMTDFELQHPKLVDILDNGNMIFLSAQSEYLPQRMTHSWFYRLFSYDPIKKCLEELQFPEHYSDMTIDLYTPSFFSLKDF